MIIAAHAVHDQIVHFYHLSALDWVDVVSALKADPARRGAARREPVRLADQRPKVHDRDQERLKLRFVGSGQLGIFANGYWGHPAMKLPPEVNLLAVTHYLQALDVQRMANKIVSILGGKTPHIQNVAVGGVSNPINTGEPVGAHARATARGEGVDRHDSRSSSTRSTSWTSPPWPPSIRSGRRSAVA